MKILYAPWREDYILNKKKNKSLKMPNNCIFCYKINDSKNDDNNLIIKSYRNTVLMMNAYPYSPGHLLVLPKKHEAELNELSFKIRTELMETLNIGIKVLKKTIKPDGINIGLNQGKAAGAGIPDHLHFHIIPRWNGDTNFITTAFNIKVYPMNIKKLYKLLKNGLE